MEAKPKSSDHAQGTERDQQLAHRRNPEYSHLLTEREWQILDLQALGFGYKEIAANLGISFSTVKNHLSSIHKKFDVHNATGAVNKAYMFGA